MSTAGQTNPKSVWITGAGGYLGRQLVAALAQDRQGIREVVAMDIKPVPAADRHPRVFYEQRDIRTPGLAEALSGRGVDSVIHLASIVTPGRGMTRDFLHEVEVGGTDRIIQACLQAGVRQIVVTSSGAAYGYHPDNPSALDERDPLRGNVEFAYSDHKRQVEERLAHYRSSDPQLRQLIFRPGTILGETANNQITALFAKPVVLGVAGAAAPFVFIWDQDVVACLHRGILEQAAGIFNLAGDGALTLQQIARRLGKPYLPLPPALLKAALRGLSAMRLTRYGPEQIIFLQYRPVLDNRRLKAEFGYIPRKTTAETFEYYLAMRERQNR